MKQPIQPSVKDAAHQMTNVSTWFPLWLAGYAAALPRATGCAMRYNSLDVTLLELVLMAVMMPLMHLFALTESLMLVWSKVWALFYRILIMINFQLNLS